MLDIRNITIGDALDGAAERWGAAEGWIFERERVTFTQLAARANEAAKALIALGLVKGDVVATWMSNRSEWLVLEMACAKAGVILTGLNTRFKIEETRYVLERSDAVALFYMPTLLNIDFMAILRAAVPGIDNHEHGRATNACVPRLRYLISLDGTPPQGTISFDDFLATGSSISDEELALRQRGCSPLDPVLMKFTSGTTSFPKGVLVQHLEALYWSAGIYDAMGIAPGEAVLNTQPFYHAGGSCGAVTAPLTIGCKVVTAEIYAPATVMMLIERERCVAKSGSAAMYIMEMEHPRFDEFDLSSLRTGWCVGPPAIFERIRTRMGVEQMVQPFGATEAGGTCGRFDDSRETRTGTCGKALPGTEIRIVDSATGQPVPPGQAGEISFRGWWAMLGYFKQPDETADTISEGGWIRTGDQGMLDEAGNLTCLGRLKDTIRPGGENASAREIEAFLLTHPAIGQVAVIAAPDDRLGEVVMAIVEVRAGHALTADEITAFCTGAIAGYKIPRHVRFTDDWPMTGSGKIQKFALRERYLPLAKPGAAASPVTGKV